MRFCSRRNQQLQWLSGGQGDPGCLTLCMPVFPHQAHVNSNRFTGCVMSLFTTRGQWTESRTKLYKLFSPVQGKTWSICVCVHFCVCVWERDRLCALAWVCMRNRGWECEREWRWANEQASKREFVYESAQHPSEVFLALFFNILGRVCFPICARNGSLMHFTNRTSFRGDIHFFKTHPNTHSHESIELLLLWWPTFTGFPCPKQ